MDQGIVDEHGYMLTGVRDDMVGPRSPLRGSDDPPSPIVPITPEHNTRHIHESGPFCGPAAGLGPYSYPVDTAGRAHSAMGRASNAARHGANPQDIQQCASEYAEANGWFHSHLSFPPDPTFQKSPQYPDGTLKSNYQIYWIGKMDSVVWAPLSGGYETTLPLYQETAPGTQEQLTILTQQQAQTLAIDFDRLRPKRGNDRLAPKTYLLVELKEIAKRWNLPVTRLNKAQIVEKIWEEARRRYPEQVANYV
jgi:hypothetical protein